MASSRILDEALRPLQSASTLIEGTFVDIGARLGSATEILDRLQATFGQLQQELESEDLLSAVETMGQVAERIAALANSSDGADLTLKKIAQLTTEIGNRILQMRKAIKAVDVLAVNAKIAAAHISSAGEEFVSFADEIGRALKIAQVNLESFGSELSSVGETVRQAAMGQGALRQRQIDAANSVPRELSRSVDTITMRQRNMILQAMPKMLSNNAGYGLLGAVEESSAAEVERLFATNVFGLLNVTRAVLPQMRRQRSGHIINISSIGGYASHEGWGVYCATKFAVEGITEALASELQPLGVRATVVEPGFFRTDFLDDQSLVKTKNRIADYADTVGAMRNFAAGANHAQPGDPAKLAKAMIAMVNAPVPPLRMPFGSDTVARIAEKNSQVTAEVQQWHDLAVSTDFTTPAV